MKLRISHRTVYRYDRPIRNIVQSLRLKPSVFEGQQTQDWKIEVAGGMCGPVFRDGAGDWIEGWTVRGPTQEITVISSGGIETRDMAGVLRGHREMIHPLTYLQTTRATEPAANLRQLADSVAHGDDTLDLAHRLSHAVSDAIAFRPGVTQARTTAAEALEQGEGVCQDHTHALIALARMKDLPARYVSGYLHSSSSGEAQDAAHAWAEIHVGSLGWVGFDAANASCPDDRYVRLGSGLDAPDAAPIRGIGMGAGVENLDVAVQVDEVESFQSQSQSQG
ncbi:transglutaminase family protein [Paracoccus stylophorae]|uniref:Transglutaminase family protein n=1 Tax=Paracoccus stylophorae TaxID=659350 RepID=A0ABY7SWB9_9RHOB|nr:transglutaminase family protein [Paracoccus stylophorae]WCR11231.1 transglutaminase family protein [Paracoccus stylophorae]